jgi:hypothetical protein
MENHSRETGCCKSRVHRPCCPRFGFRLHAQKGFAWVLFLVAAVVEGPDSVSFRSHKLTSFCLDFRAMSGLPALEPPAESDVLVAAQQLITLKNEHPARDKAETSADTPFLCFLFVFSFALPGSARVRSVVGASPRV